MLAAITSTRMSLVSDVQAVVVIVTLIVLQVATIALVTGAGKCRARTTTSIRITKNQFTSKQLSLNSRSESHDSSAVLVTRFARSGFTVRGSLHDVLVASMLVTGFVRLLKKVVIKQSTLEEIHPFESILSNYFNLWVNIFISFGLIIVH